MTLIALLSAAAIVLVDQLLKFAVYKWLMPIQSLELIPRVLSFDYVENTGMAFGFLPNNQWLIMAFTLAICVGIAVALFRYRHHSRLSWMASAMILGGGIGNIVDRLARGFVVDYIHFSFFPFVFNLADICVVVGVVLLVLHMLCNTGEEQAPAGKAGKA